MATSLTAVRAALATRLATITLAGGTQLRASATMTGQISPPQAVVLPNRSGTFISYDVTEEANVADITLEVVLLVSYADERASQLLEDGVLSPSGSLSVRAAVAADPRLAGACDYAVVTQASNYGLLDWQGTQYLAARLEVTVGIS